MVALLAAAAVAICGAANAYWGGSGIGTGGGNSASVVGLTLSPATAAGGLFPGANANVELTITNPNTSTVRIGSLALDTAQGTGGFAVDAGHAACSVAALSFTTQTNGGAGWDVPAKVGAVDGALPVTLTNSLAMGLGAASACQGASFTGYLAAGP